MRQQKRSRAMSDVFGFKTEAEALRKELVAWRRDFHMHPELSFQEFRSAEVIAVCLAELGYQVQTGVAQTGVVGLLEGHAPGPVVMARFDMDALPVTDEKKVEYASQNQGVMHACGHDAHMAIGLGVATLMKRHRDEMQGTLKLIFQPAEEGLGGARDMIEAGVMEDPRPDFFLSLHVFSELQAGSIAARPGPVMAAADEFTCTVNGRGGHGAAPHQTVDPIVAAAQVLNALQTIVSRNVGPLEAAVVSVGSIHGGTALNIIPPQVKMQGSIRTFSPEIQELVWQRMQDVVDGVAEACGATVELEISTGTPAVINDQAVTAVVQEAAGVVVGAENVTFDHRTMGSEDAALFMQKVPGCYFFVGSGNAELGTDAPHHNPLFDVDEDALPLGAATLALSLAHYLL
jgi:amidohydrolase